MRPNDTRRSRSDSERPSARDRTNPFDEGIGRRRLLESSTAVGASAAAVAGCLDADETESTERAPTVYAFNTGDRTMTIIDAERDEALETVYIDTTASFPANQYGTGADSNYDVCWLNVSGGVEGLDARTLETVARVETGFEPTYPNLTPNEDHLVVASGGTTEMDPDPTDPADHVIVRIDADPDSETFGSVTGEISTGYTGPCDVTFGPDNEYAYVTEIANERLRVVGVDPFETIAEIDVGEPVGEGRALPFMCTAAFDGSLLLVENGEGELGPDPDVPRRGSERIWDLSDPERPRERERITRGDGLPAMPITSEIGPNTEVAYLCTPDADSVTVIDLNEYAVDRVLDVGGSAISGAWGPHREKLYVPVQTANHVAVVDHSRREVVATIDAGEAPTGAVGGTARPTTDPEQRIQASIAALGLEFGRRETTICPEGNCFCG